MTTPSEFLDVAASLARQIADAAIWHSGRCNWIGFVPRDPALTQGRAVLEALGADLYNGTSGVALFLAEAAAALDDDQLAATARGALRHALAHAHRVGGDGLQMGAPGIAYAAGRVGLALDCDFAFEGAHELLARWRERRGNATAWDLIGGCAGTISALVALADVLEDATLVETAAQAGEELLAAAERSAGGGCFWRDPSNPTVHGLCGYSHGAAGIGQALLELWSVTGDPRMHDAGSAAFEYERAWLQRRGGTWPDLREIRQAAGRDVPAPMSPTWCHGAPGIALSRLRAAQLIDSQDVRDDQQAAVGLTRLHVGELCSIAPDDFSLCHGAAGAADVLLCAGDGSGLAERIGEVGIERHHLTASGYPCGTSHGETPGLYIGLAGIGLYYLRLCDSSTPTALFVHKKSGLTALQEPA